MSTTILVIIGVYILLNLIAFAAYGIDKIKAKSDMWRTPEKTLLTLAFFGPFGGYSAMQIFRHKTQKQPFPTLVPLFLGLHIILILVAAVLLSGIVSF